MEASVVMNKIPKIIHYCWFGGNPLPEIAKKCIESWKKYCPDYEIKEWNESNFDINCCEYIQEAYNAQKWAFVSDYARFYILYNYGGVYFDTDVELIRPIEDILEKGPFMGCEKDALQSSDLSNVELRVNPGLGIATAAGTDIYKALLSEYNERHFILPDGSYDLTTVVTITTELLKRYGLKNLKDIQIVEGVYIYPMEYFCPLDDHTGQLSITSNTCSIHHFDGSWLTDELKVQKQLRYKYNKHMSSDMAYYVARFMSVKKVKGLKCAVKEVLRWIRKK